MSDLRKKLLEAGLVTPRQAAAVEADATPSKPRKSRGGANRGPAPRLDREPTAEEAARAAELVAAEKRALPGSGSRRYYYVSRAGTVPFIEVDESTGSKLERGKLALVEQPDGDAWLVDAACARKVVGLDPSWVRTFHG